jgi:prophage regulatory protein
MEARLAKAAESDEWLRLPQVAKITGLKGSTIYEWARKGKFPKQIRLSPKLSVWSSQAVASWQESKAKGK